MWRKKASAAISWYFLRTFVGLREGTLVSAVCVGLFVKAIGGSCPKKRRKNRTKSRLRKRVKTKNEKGPKETEFLRAFGP